MSEPWIISYDNHSNDKFSDGLRVSTDCPCRRVRQSVVPDQYFEFPEELSVRGHGFERVIGEHLRTMRVPFNREVNVPWEYGDSHLDFWLPQGCKRMSIDGPAFVELKANKDARLAPENVRQVRRQMFVTERALAAKKALTTWVDPKWHELDPDLVAMAEWRIVVIDPLKWVIPNPEGTIVKLSDEERSRLEAEWDAVDTAMQLPNLKEMVEYAYSMPDCTCGQCWRRPQFELSNELATHAAAYDYARGEGTLAEIEKKHHRDVLKAHLFALRGIAAGDAVEPVEFIGGGWKVSLTKNGQIQVKAVDTSRVNSIL